MKESKKSNPDGGSLARSQQQCEKIIKNIIRELQKGPYQDLSDVGNLIGIALGDSGITNELDPEGNDLRGLMLGIQHGVDLTILKRKYRR